MAEAGKINVLMSIKKALFSKQMKSIISSFEKLGASATAAFAAFKIGQGLMIKTAAEFEQGMIRVAAVSQATQSQYRSMEKAALSMAAKTQYTAREVADGMGFIAMAGYNANQVVEAMPHALDLAAAGMIGIADASNIVTNMMAGMGLQMEDLARANDTIVSAITGANVDVSMLGEAFKYVGPVAKTAGASFEDVTAALGLLGNAGIQGSMAGTTLRGAFARLAKPSRKALAIMEQYGVVTKDSSGNLLNLSQIINNIEMSGMAEGTEGAANMLEIFGLRAGPGMQALVDMGGHALAKFTARLEKAGGTAKRIADLQMQTLSGRFKIMQSAIEGLVIDIGQRFIPATKALINKITSVVNWVNSWDSDMKNLILTLGEAFMATVAMVGAIGLMIKFFKSAALKSVIRLFAGILVPVLAVAAAVAGVILAVGSIRMVFEQNKMEIASIISDIKMFFISLWEDIVDGVNIAVDAVISAVKGMTDPINKVLQPISEGLITAIGFVTRADPKEIQKMIEESQKAEGGLLNLDETINLIKEGSEKAKAAFEKLSKGVKDLATDVAKGAKDFGKMFFADTKAGLKEAWNAGLKTLSIDKLMDLLKGTFGKYVTIGKGEIKLPKMKIDIAELDPEAKARLAEGQRRMAEAANAAKSFSEVFKKKSANIFDMLVGSMGEIGSIVMAAKQGFETGGPWGAVIAVLIELFMKTQTFSQTVRSLNMSLGTLVKLLDFLLAPAKEMLPVFNVFIRVIVAMIKAVTGLSFFMNIAGKALSAAAAISMQLIEVHVKVWNWVLDGIQWILRKLSMDKAARAVEKFRINVEQIQRDVDIELNDFQYNVGKASEAAADLGDSLANAPEGFKVALEKFKAIIPESSTGIETTEKPASSITNNLQVNVDVRTDADADEIAARVASALEQKAWESTGAPMPPPNNPYNMGTSSSI